ncbi:hypothetical protein PIB30_034826 [Stylosanthes scabra]|uniref:fructokinase n=1 Tax=Stylosanthes scabra TaxID=79078 RepID=A0ABU6WFT4_9FABA|nr:hypothetical protein [Stylosanthes scabra]
MKKAGGTGCCFPPMFGKSRTRPGGFRLISNSSFEESSSSTRSGGQYVSLNKRKSSLSSHRRRYSSHNNHQQQQYQTAPMIVCFGEMMINLVPAVSGVSVADADEFKKSPAGSTANVAVAISRLGGSSAFIGKVGKDEFGYMLSDILMQNGVDNSGLLFDEHARTMLAFHALKSDGEPQFLFYRHPSADMLIRPEELDVRLIRKATIFHYSSFSLVMEPSKSTHLAAMNLAKMCGCVLSYAPNLTLPIWPSSQAARQAIMSIWNFADIIKVSSEEVGFLGEGDDPYDDQVIMNKLFHPRLKLMLVTEGPRGCRYYTQEFKGWVSGFEVEVVDKDGAGDAFLAAFLCILAAHTYIFQDETRLREALVFANATAAVTLTKKDAIPSLPTKDAVLRLLLSSHFN